IAGYIHGVPFDSKDPETAQARYILLISFEKDHRPRVCAVRPTPDGSGLIVIPSTLQGRIATALDREGLAKLERLTTDPKMGPFFIPAFTRSALKDAFPTTGNLQKESLLPAPSVIWYAGLPCIAYQWAPATLQEAASRGRMDKWTIPQRLSMLHNVAK